MALPSQPMLDLQDESAVAAKAQRENFPVALRLLPAAKRRRLLAIYAFARLADDLADEAEGDRLALLDGLEQELDRAFAGRARHPVLMRLAESLAEAPLPDAPFRRLIEAGRQDQRVQRYATWQDLRAYCDLSAAPVGELVLHVFGAATSERLRRSADVCAALQLVEHVQDVAEDRARGRVYLPAEDLARHACAIEELDAREASLALRGVLAFEARRAEGLLAQGEALIASLGGFARLAVAGFVAGGRATLAALARVDFDVLAHPAPRPRTRDLLLQAVRLLVSAASATRSERP